MDRVDAEQDALIRSVTAGGPLPAGIAAARLDRYARSLLAKRQAEVERTFPRTLAVAPDAGQRYRRWLRDNPAPHGDTPLGPGLSEALRALPLLRTLGDPEWAGELLAWEVLSRATRADGVERTLHAAWAVDEAARDIAAGIAPDPRPVRTSYRFTRSLPVVTAGAPRILAERPLFGVGWRRPLADALAADPPDVVEVTADHFFGDPAGIEALAERSAIVLHDVGCSIGSRARDPARLRRLADLVRRSRPLLFSDHLAITRSPSGIDVGHLCPIAPTWDQLAVVVDRVAELQDALGVPVALENIATPFRIPGDMDEEAFFGELVHRTGCGLVVDVTNALYDARNDGYDAWERLSRLPLHAAVQVHLAGGDARGDWWIDSHAADVEDASFDLLSRLRGVAPLVAVIVERDARLPAAAVLLAEAGRAREVWHGSR